MPEFIEQEKKSRGQIKALGGKIVGWRAVGEVTYQVWELPDGSLWNGHDWYNDNMSFVYKGAPKWYLEEQERDKPAN